MIEDIDNFLKKNHKKYPISHLAEKCNLNPIDITSRLRRNKLAREVFAVDHIFIGENLRTRKFNTQEVLEKLYITKTQYQQIVNKKHKKTILLNRDNITSNFAINSTKFLIEEKLKLEIDSELPKISLSKELINHSNPIYQWAIDKSNKHSTFKYFGAVSYLICLCYPDKFRPFNFRGGSRGYTKSDYFSLENDGKVKFIDACIWILSKEISIKYFDLFKKENKDIVLDSFTGFSNTLKRDNLCFYGLNERIKSKLFSNHRELISEVIKHLNVKKMPDRLSTRQLKEILNKNKISPEECIVNNCAENKNIEIHHLVPVSKSYLYPEFNYDSFINLVPLCPNHHKKIQHYELSPDELVMDKSVLIKKIISKESS